MILNTDEEIKDTILDSIDSIPLSIGLLKKLGWLHHTGHERWVRWTTFIKPGVTYRYPYIERYNNDNYYLIVDKNRSVTISNVKDLREHGLL